MDEPPTLLLPPATLEAPNDDATNDAALLPMVLPGPVEDPAAEDAPATLLDGVAEEPVVLLGGPDVPPKDPPSEEDVPVAETPPVDPLLELVDSLDSCAVQPPTQTIRIVATVLQTRRVMNMVCRSLGALWAGPVDAGTLRGPAARGFSFAASGLCWRATRGVLRHWEDVLAWWFATPLKGFAHHDAPVR